MRNFASTSIRKPNPLNDMIMTKEVSMYCLAAIANYSTQHQDDEVYVTTKVTCGNMVYLEVTDKSMTEDGCISTSLLKSMESIAESWGGWAHVEYDRKEDQLLIILG